MITSQGLPAQIAQIRIAGDDAVRSTHADHNGGSVCVLTKGLSSLSVVDSWVHGPRVEGEPSGPPRRAAADRTGVRGLQWTPLSAA